MKNLITAAQFRQADQHTIETEPIASIDLMERASRAFVETFTLLYPDNNTPILICCGTGNNGGDGLAIARLLQQGGYDSIAVWIARFSENETADFATNLARLYHSPIPVTEFLPTDEFPPVRHAVLIDALLGSGLNKPLEGDWLRLVRHLSSAGIPVVAVDTPTGLPADGSIPPSSAVLAATDAITFQRPKLSFFFPESEPALNRFHVADIGLDESFIEQFPSEFKLVEERDITRLYRPRGRFSHKGTFGHALLIAGRPQTMGAALLCAGASVYSRAGLTTACIPKDGLTALNARHPQVMYCPREELASRWKTFDAVGIGPGLGTESDMLERCLSNAPKPMVLDADALTAISEQPKLLDQLPEDTVLTPHMKEFDRLFGSHTNWWDRVRTARERAIAHRIVIVLKNRYTFIVTPDGRVCINPTGNAAMATGGTGDVLTGMITAFLAQGYPAGHAALLACYFHGAAGDHLTSQGWAISPASQLLTAIPLAVSAMQS